jgi:acetylornithine deacetylase/succinyl-diaminopimelate desuccinylase-like protein
MKPEAEIRRHLEDLRTCVQIPCACAGGRHEMKCLIGAKMMTATIETLEWALGENPGMDELVEHLAKGAADFRLENNQ